MATSLIKQPEKQTSKITIILSIADGAHYVETAETGTIKDRIIEITVQQKTKKLPTIAPQHQTNSNLKLIIDKLPKNIEL